MTRRLKKKRTLGLAALLLLLLSAGAVAYFTAGGAGTGTASVGSSSQLVLHGTTPAGGKLYPGTSETVTLTADNPSPGHQQVGTVRLAGIKACTNNATWNPALNAGAGACPAGSSEVPTCEDFDPGNAADANSSDFYMADVTENHDLASGSGLALPNNGTLQMNDLSHAQDQCQGVGLYLTLAS